MSKPLTSDIAPPDPAPVVTISVGDHSLSGHFRSITLGRPRLNRRIVRVLMVVECEETDLLDLQRSCSSEGYADEWRDGE